MDIDRIVVIDTGGSAAHAAARRFRALKVPAVVYQAQGLKPGALTESVKGIVIEGSGHQLKGAPGAMESALGSGKPVLALGRNARALLIAMGGSAGEQRLSQAAANVRFAECALFESLSSADRYFDRAEGFVLPEGVRCIAEAGNFCAAFSFAEKSLFGAQFSVEANDPDGMRILKNFAENVCRISGEWTMPMYLDFSVRALREAAPEGSVAAAVSGSAHSLVSAALALRAFGERVKFVLCDTGLLRAGERERVKCMFQNEIGAPLEIEDLTEEVLSVLSGAADVHEKNERVKRSLLKCLSGKGDVIVRGSGQSGAFALTPLHMLYREEVRELGLLMDLPAALLTTQPFPEAGLAVRMSGEVTKEKIEILRCADEIFTREIETAGLDKKLYQYYATLARTDDGRYAVILHALVSATGLTGFAFRMPYDLIERAVCEILTRQPLVGGVMYDVTGR